MATHQAIAAVSLALKGLLDRGLPKEEFPDAKIELLRPADFDTLATWLYAEAARGTYEEGAVAALAIVAAGLLPVVLLARTHVHLERR